METVLKEYDAKLDSKNRITLRDIKYDYYHVLTYEDGSIILSPRKLISPTEKISREQILNAVSEIRKKAMEDGTADMSIEEINSVIYGD